MKKYQIIYADPPWQYGKWGNNPNPLKSYKGGSPKPLPYPSMSVEEISNLPVIGIADVNCLLFMWTTNKYLPYAFNIIEKWGFRYAQTLVWCKAYGCLNLGGLFAPSTEYLIFGRKGTFPRMKRMPSTWYQFKRQTKHSQKPKEFRELIDSIGLERKIELFARQKIAGWDVWGNEVESDITLEAR